MNRATDLAIRHPWRILGLATAVTLALAWQFRGSGDGTDPQHMLDASQPNAASDTPPGAMVGMMGMMMRSMPAGIPASELPDADSPSASLIARHCSQCHEIPSPASHSPADWVPTLRGMGARMQHMAHMGRMMARMTGRRMGMMRAGEIVAPTEEEERAILEYLQRHALKPLPEATPPDLGDEAARLFARSCSRCHALPDPAQHTPEEWPAVVERMRENMRRMGVPEIGPDEARAITGYLQRVAEPAGTPRR